MIVIDVTAKVSKATAPMQKVVDIVTKLEKRIDATTAAMNRLASAAAKAGSAYNPGVASSGTSRPGSPVRAGSGSNRAVAPPQATPLDRYRYLNAMNTASGGRYQMQRNHALMSTFRHYQGGANSGDPKAMRAIQSLAPSVAKMMAPKKGAGHFAMQALMSSRFGAGAGGGMQLMPLVGRTVQALAALGPAALGAAAGIGTMAGMIATVVNSIQSVGAFTGRMAGNATTPGTQGALDRLNGVLGGDASGMAQQFGSNIKHGVGAGWAASHGINPYSGPFGDINVGDKFLKALQVIGKAQTYAEAQRMAAMTGTPGAANYWYLSESNKRDAQSRASGYSEKDIRSAVNGQYALTKLSDAFEKLINKLAVSFAPVLTTVIDGISKALDWLGKAWENLPAWVRLAIAPLSMIDTNGSKVDSANKSLQNSQEAQTRAIIANTRALKEFRETQGGGSRARGALPGKVSGARMTDPAVQAAIAGGLG